MMETGTAISGYQGRPKSRRNDEDDQHHQHDRNEECAFDVRHRGADGLSLVEAMSARCQD